MREAELRTGTFGDSALLCRELLVLVRSGQKIATASLLWEWEAEGQSLPIPGEREIVLDWNQDPTLVIEYVNVQVHAFSGVPADFAWDEGEGDRSLESWRRGHWAFFTRASASLGRVPSEDMPIVCARFRVVADLEKGT